MLPSPSLSRKQKKELLKEVRAARKNLAKQMASEAGITEVQANEIINQMGKVGQKVSDTLIANTEQQIRATLPLSQQLAAFTGAPFPEDDPYGSVLSDAADELDRIAKELCSDVVDCIGAWLDGGDTGDYSYYYMFVQKIVDFKSEKEFVNAQMKMLKSNFPNNKSLEKVEKQAESLLRFNRVLAKMFKPLTENKHSAAFTLLQNAVAYNEHLAALQSRINKNLVGGDVDIDIGMPVPEALIEDLDEIVVGMTLLSPAQIKAIYLLDETGLTGKSVSKVDFESLARSFAMEAFDNLWNAGAAPMWLPRFVMADFRRDVEAEIQVIALRQAKRMLASYKERGMTELGRVSDSAVAYTTTAAAYLKDEYIVPGSKAAYEAAKVGAAATGRAAAATGRAAATVTREVVVPAVKAGAAATAAGVATAATGGSAAIGAGLSLTADFAMKAAAAAKAKYKDWKTEREWREFVNALGDAVYEDISSREGYVPSALMEQGAEKLKSIHEDLYEAAGETIFQFKLENAPEATPEMSPESEAYLNFVVTNNIVLDMMLDRGNISQKMYDRAMKEKLPVASVTAMLNGLKKGRETQAELRLIEKEVQEASRMTVDQWALMFSTEEIDAFLREVVEARDSGLLVDEIDVEVTRAIKTADDALAAAVSQGLPGFYAVDSMYERPFEDQRPNPNPGGVRWYA
jgi:hypothetical protein